MTCPSVGHSQRSGSRRGPAGGGNEAADEAVLDAAVGSPDAALVGGGGVCEGDAAALDAVPAWLEEGGGVCAGGVVDPVVERVVAEGARPAGRVVVSAWAVWRLGGAVRRNSCPG